MTYREKLAELIKLNNENAEICHKQSENCIYQSDCYKHMAKSYNKEAEYYKGIAKSYEAELATLEGDDEP